MPTELLGALGLFTVLAAAAALAALAGLIVLAAAAALAALAVLIVLAAAVALAGLTVLVAAAALAGLTVLVAAAALAGLTALVVVATLVVFGVLAARGMVIFPYGKGNLTMSTILRGRAAKRSPNPRAEKLPDNSGSCQYFLALFRACYHPQSAVASMAGLPQSRLSMLDPRKSIDRPGGFSQRMAEIEPFRVVEVLARATQLAAGGADIVHMAAGEPDFVTAAPIVEAGQAALARGATHYSQAAGIPQLREALSRHYADVYGLDVAPSRILITPGASGALLLIAALLMNPGDGMLMTDPGYPCNRHFMRLVEGRGELVPVGADSNYQLNAELVQAHWQDNTIGAMVASPANPTGTALSREELTALSGAVRSRNGYLLVDEIYHGLVYDGSAPSVLEVDPDAFVINSFSKYFGMTGWRLGWLVAPEAATAEMEKLSQNLFISMSTMAQYAALAGFEPGTREILEQRREIFGQRRDYLLSAVQELGFLVPCHPQGAFYIYADASRFTDDSQQFCLNLLEEHGIALTPGVDFGHHLASQHVRFSYTTSMDRLELAVERLAKVLG